MTDSNIHLELGDIIEFKAPSDPIIDNKRFYIDYIDNTQIDLLDDKGEKLTLKISPDGSFENESIEEVDLLNRASSSGYALQHDLLPSTWINIYFDGDIPTTVIGQITNIVEDQIEVSVWNRETKNLEKEPLYIDFAYKGLPKDIPIESIEIRETSPMVSDSTTDIQYEEATPIAEVLETDDGREVVDTEPMPDINQQLGELITEADQIIFGEDLEVFAHEVDVPEEERKYSIEKQTSDMLDDLLSNIPNKKRTPEAINNIHKTIERYKQLRKEFSIYDSHDNILGSKTHGDDYKPLVDKLEDFTHKIYWTLPVVQTRKKLYNIDSFDKEADVEELDLANMRSEESDLIQSYYQNDIAGDNKYYSLIRGLKRFYTPYDNPTPPQVEQDKLLAVKEVNTNINAVVNNFNNFESSVAENSEIKIKKYFIQGYILGANTLQYKNIKRGKLDITLNKISQNDTISLQSLLILPEQVFKFSRINLPTTNILQRANLNTTFINYWQLLNKNKEVNTTIIEKFGKENDRKTFLKTATEYVIGDDINDPSDINKYNKFLNTVIPTTNELLDIVKDKINTGYSMYSIIKFMEPFMIYHTDLTYKQYKLFLECVTDNIAELKREYIKTQTKLNRTVARYTNTNPRDIPYLLLLLGRDLYENIKKLYHFPGETINEISNSTFLSHITKLDYGRYYNTLVAKASLSLMIPNGREISNQLEQLYNKDIEKLDAEPEDPKEVSETLTKKTEPCNTYILSKKYTSIDDLDADNDKSIYFDKEYDKTYYDMVDEPSYKQIVKGDSSYEEKIKLLAEKLAENIGLTLENALRESSAMINKKRQVIDGDYGVLVINDGKKLQHLYFIRQDNKWLRDTNITDDVFGDTSKEFCNLSEKCLIVKDSCETLEKSETMIKNQNLLQIINEFDETMYKSQENISSSIERKIDKYMLRLPKLSKLKINSIYKYNNQRYYLGDNIIISDEVDSPYSKLRDKIFGIPDITQRQNLICDFSVNFTKSAIEGQDPWWRYCNDTNAKLLPTFIVELADAFVNGDNYIDRVSDICKKQGKLSDDGEAWVDKYSGYFITYREFDTEEGHDESGFKISTREIMENNPGKYMQLGNTLKKQDMSPEKIMIYNVIMAMAEYMGIQIQPYVQDIIKDTTTSLKKHAPNNPKSGKAKKPASVKKYNIILVCITLSYFFIYIQTSIPTLQPRKRFPNCKRSFTGYPLYSEEDLTGIAYVACIASKLSKTSIEPWNSIAGKSQIKIKSLLKDIIGNYIVNTQNVRVMMAKKIKYVRENREEEIVPGYLSIKNWINFLPPLVSIKLPTIQNVTAAFRETLANDIKRGKIDQFEKLLVLQSKILYFSLEIQVSINNTVNKNAELLHNNNGEPYIENSCCDDGTINTLEYFETKDSGIKRNNIIVKELNDIFMTIGDMGKASILFYDKNTKPVYPPLLEEFSEETIFRAFIVYCKFNSSVAIDERLRAVCLDKPADFNVQDSIEEKIEKLKRSGKNYRSRELDQLLNIINKKNIVNLQLNNTTLSDLERLRGEIEYSDESNSNVFDLKFRAMLLDYIDTYNISDKQHASTEKFLDYLNVINGDMQNTITSFLRKNLEKNKDNKAVIECIENITDFAVEDRSDIISGIDETTYKTIQFIENILQFVSHVYPNIILNKIDPCSNSCRMPKHWNLSDFHNNDLINILNRYYELFKPLYQDDKIIKDIIQSIESANKEIYRYASFTKYYSPIKNKDSVQKSIFTSELTLNLFRYYFNCMMVNIVKAGGQEGDMLILQDKTTYIDKGIVGSLLVDEEEQELPATAEEYFEEQVVAAEDEEVKRKAAKFIFVLSKVIINRKKTINYNYDTLMGKIHKFKEEEKRGITDYLKEMTEEEREIENLFKSNKLERWSKGMQKGFRTYQGSTYDEERKIMEDQAILENKLGKQNFITEQNKDIYLMEALQEQALEEEINKEVYSLSGIGNDDDYIGDGDEYY